MYPLHALGRFIIPDTPEWVEALRYQAEPPLVIRGAMNPWALERQREIWMAEEAAWKEIQQKQVAYRQVRLAAEAALRRFNAIIRQIEAMTGKKSGMLSAGNVASFVAGAGGNPYIMAALALKMVVEMILGSKKQKKIKRLIEEATRLQANILAYHAQMETIAGEVQRLTMIGEAYRDMQTVRSTEVARQSEAAYTQQQSTERERGKALHALNMMARQRVPMRKGVYDEL